MSTEKIVLGGGCFWCLHASYKLVKGVSEVIQGYAGGIQKNPNYEQVYSETAGGHAEVVEVAFDPAVITLSEILEIFWTIHDPTTLNRQGSDIGPSYRSIILYGNDKQKAVIEASKTKAQTVWKDPIVTEIKPLDVFYPAEDYQYDYEINRPDYCQVVINPKLDKLRAKFAERLK